MVRSATAALVTVMLAGTPVCAADRADDRKTATADTLETAAVATATPQFAPSIRIPDAIVQRPVALPMLYASLAALQAYDGYSTMQGQSRGVREANPAMQWMAASPARFLTLKAVTTAASIAVAERMWKRNKAGAVVTMALLNGMSAAVAARNASVLKQTR